MRDFFRLSILLPLLVMTTPAKSDVLLLIHDYLSNHTTWLQSNVVEILLSEGWSESGLYQIRPDGKAQLYIDTKKKNKQADADKMMFIVDLPSEAPILVQSDFIANIVKDITQRHPDEDIILVGHSAGGVASRASVVRHKLENVTRIITIASPHLGTDIADAARDVSSLMGPATMLPGMFGGDIARTSKRSEQLYADLSPENKGNFLNWLNQQPHPSIIWDSIIHTGQNDSGNDSYVAAGSQDMNNVKALKDRSSINPVTTEHELSYVDGLILKKLLANE